MFLLIGTFIAGMLTVLAPCVLALLPIIIGGSVSGDVKDKKRPLIITASLAVSLLTFTLLLKVTSLLINIPPRSISYVSGGIIVILGALTLFPSLYARVIARLGIEQRAQTTLSKGYADKRQYVGPIIIGASLGPVFSSCSPVYAYILATILPVNFAQAMVYIVSYILGLSVVLLLIGYYGQRFVSKIRFASNSKGWFQRAIATLFIITGLLIITGYDKRLQTWVSTHTPFNFDALSSKLLPADERTKSDDKLFNLQPYAAPEFTGLESWINSPPLTLAEQRGKVVLVDFWTYSCINCIRNNPYLIEWHEKYKDKGLVIVGVHAPEFAFEKVTKNVEDAVNDQGITYPVALDNEFSTWYAFRNRSWPSAYFIDANGQVRRLHEGEGQYSESEAAIRQLLTESGADVSDIPFDGEEAALPISDMQTPETYMGKVRASGFTNDKPLGAKSRETFELANELDVNEWTLGGTWEVQDKQIIARGNSRLRFRVAAKDVYAVIGSTKQASIKVLLNNKLVTENAGVDVKNGKVEVQEDKLYKLLSFPQFESSNTIELVVPDGVQINAFTFGS